MATDVASRCIESVITQSLIVLSKSQLAQTVTRFNEDVIKTEWRRQQYNVFVAFVPHRSSPHVDKILQTQHSTIPRVQADITLLQQCVDNNAEVRVLEPNGT